MTMGDRYGLVSFGPNLRITPCSSIFSRAALTPFSIGNAMRRGAFTACGFEWGFSSILYSPCISPRPVNSLGKSAMTLALNCSLSVTTLTRFSRFRPRIAGLPSSGVFNLFTTYTSVTVLSPFEFFNSAWNLPSTANC